MPLNILSIGRKRETATERMKTAARNKYVLLESFIIRLVLSGGTRDASHLTPALSPWLWRET